MSIAVFRLYAGSDGQLHATTTAINGPAYSRQWDGEVSYVARRLRRGAFMQVSRHTIYLPGVEDVHYVLNGRYAGSYNDAMAAFELPSWTADWCNDTRLDITPRYDALAVEVKLLRG